MNDIVGGDQKTNLRVRWNDQRFIDLEQIIFTLLPGVVDLFLRRGQIGKKRDRLTRLVQILVLPLPLISGDEYVEFRLVVVIHLEQRRCGREGHGNQNQEGDNRPRHLDLGALVKLRSLVSFRLTMRINRVEHRAKHQNPDNHADPHNQHMELEDIGADFGDTRRHIDLIFSAGQRCKQGQSRCRENSPHLVSTPFLCMARLPRATEGSKSAGL